VVFRSRNSSVGILIRLRAGGSRNGVSITGRGKRLSDLRSFSSASEANCAFYLIRIGGCLPALNLPEREANHSPPVR
jgi:hypothetical protein